MFREIALHLEQAKRKTVRKLKGRQTCILLAKAAEQKAREAGRMQKEAERWHRSDPASRKDEKSGFRPR